MTFCKDIACLCIKGQPMQDASNYILTSAPLWHAVFDQVQDVPVSASQ